MSAPIGNKYAQKWTIERTLEALNFIDSYSCSKDCLYLGHALSVAGYYDDLWAYWRRKWYDRYEVISLMKQIMLRFEVRIFEKMAKREIPMQVGMFALKHHYGWGGKTYSPTSFSLEYIDKEPFAETKPEPLAEKESETTPQAEPEQPQDPQPEAIKEEIVKAKELIRQKMQQYNALHPTAQIFPPAGYFDGKPPANMPAIEFDGGYFLKG